MTMRHYNQFNSSNKNNQRYTRYTEEGIKIKAPVQRRVKARCSTAALTRTACTYKPTTTTTTTPE